MFNNVQFPEDQAYQGESSFPFIQWVNGQKVFAKINPVLGNGGWAMQETNVLGELPWVKGDLPHKNGDSTPCYFANKLSFALLAEKFRWFVVDPQSGQTVFIDKYEPGARGKYQVLVAVKEAGDLQGEPWMLTLKGMAAKHLYDVFKMYRSKLLPFAAMIAKKRLPLYAFWCEVGAGEPLTVGTAPNTSIITPPVMKMPELGNRDAVTKFLIERFVGQQAIDLFSAWWPVAQDWAKDKPKVIETINESVFDEEERWELADPPPGL